MAYRERLVFIVVAGFCIGVILSFVLQDYPLVRLLVDIVLGIGVFLMWRRSMT